jgi:Tfp pilus assembly protein PilV
MKMNSSSTSQAFARRALAYSLIEVMIALAIFFMAAFSILALVSMTLRNARILQTKKGGNAGLIAGGRTRMKFRAMACSRWTLPLPVLPEVHRIRK